MATATERPWVKATDQEINHLHYQLAGVACGKYSRFTRYKIYKKLF